jgi:hypothetical protein
MGKVSLSRHGLRYNEEANVPGAQTERWGEAGPVSVLLRGWDSPAVLVPEIRDQESWVGQAFAFFDP